MPREKVCKRCGCTFDDDGRARYCPDCKAEVAEERRVFAREARSAYHQAHKDDPEYTAKYAAYHREYYAKNREFLIAQTGQYSKDHADVRNQSRRAKYANDPEARARRSIEAKEWYQAHKSEIAARNKAAREAKKNAKGE